MVDMASFAAGEAIGVDLPYAVEEGVFGRENWGLDELGHN